MTEHLSFRRERSVEDSLLNVEWITVRNDDGTEWSYPVKVDQVTRHSDGTVTVQVKAMTADDD